MKAASLIKPGDTLFIDFGTTTFEFSQRVKLIDNITVITNSPLLANTLQENPTIETILIGGQFNAALNACLGGIALKNITEFFADYAVIGAGAIHHLYGVMDQHVDEAAIAQKMMENSDKLMVLADSTKTNKHAINVVTGWENIDYLITTCKEFKLTDNKKRSKTKIIVAELT
ncbi:DeoR/GlpR family DNA-binding transcription regulator [Providencia manganoxydans]